MKDGTDRSQLKQDKLFDEFERRVRIIGSERETVTPPDGMGVLILGNSGYTRQDERDGLEQSTGLAGVSGLRTRNRWAGEKAEAVGSAQARKPETDLLGLWAEAGRCLWELRDEVRDLPCFEFRTTVVELYRVRCPDCGVQTEKVPQLPSKAPFSKRFEEAVGLACESAAVRRVARQFGLSSSTVRAMDLRYLRRWAEGRRKPALRQMGVDEIYLGKKQKFLTVVSNLETGEPLWFGRERKKQGPFVWLPRFIQAPSTPKSFSIIFLNSIPLSFSHAPIWRRSRFGTLPAAQWRTSEIRNLITQIVLASA
jgi:hypothetical protein